MRPGYDNRRLQQGLRSVNRSTTDQDLALWLSHSERIRGNLIYDSELFDRATIESMMEDHVRLLEEICHAPEARIDEVLRTDLVLS